MSDSAQDANWIAIIAVVLSAAGVLGGYWITSTTANDSSEREVVATRVQTCFAISDYHLHLSKADDDSEHAWGGYMADKGRALICA